MIKMMTRFKPMIEIVNRFSGWLLLAAIGWLCWTAARLLWLLLAVPAPPALSILPLQNDAASAVDNSSIFAIFADPVPTAAAGQPPPDVALKGVLLAIPKSLSSALLDVNGEVKNYRINDSLGDSGYTLVAVDWNAVIIADAADQQTVISMADSMPLDQRGLAADAVDNQRLPDNNMLPAAPSTLEGTPMLRDDGANAAGTDTNNSNSAIEEAVTALQENPASYLSRMGLMASGEGYQVTSAMPAGVRNRLGLESGDKVLSVNGKSVGNSSSQDAGLLQQVQQAGEAQVEVQRGDQIITIRQQF
ncbi:type II secretion system protein N [Psychrobacter frigidicola]|uniref:type II secretion system protein N n=1 Tax=Psychrobacter frigidicola TaxID=45611 RepID=UPI001919E008|nr:type II secretion system protein N [Psychrobacter frigidicola]